MQNLARLANVSAAARQTGISRQYANRERQKHEHFASMWAEAEEQAADLLRQTARVRATVGDAVEIVQEKFDADGKLVARIVTRKKVYDNALLARQLIAYCPEFREQRDIRLGGISDGQPVKVEVDLRRTPERLEELVNAMLELDIEVPGYETRR